MAGAMLSVHGVDIIDPEKDIRCKVPLLDRGCEVWIVSHIEQGAAGSDARVNRRVSSDPLLFKAKGLLKITDRSKHVRGGDYRNRRVKALENHFASKRPNGQGLYAAARGQSGLAKLAHKR